MRDAFSSYIALPCSLTLLLRAESKARSKVLSKIMDKYVSARGRPGDAFEKLISHIYKIMHPISKPFSLRGRSIQ